MRKTLVAAVAAGLIVGSAGSALAAWQYSGNVYATAAGHSAGSHAAIQVDTSAGCQYETELWATAGGSWYWGVEYNLYRATDNALVKDGPMYYSGPYLDANIGSSADPSGYTYYYSLGKFAIYNGNGYNYWWTNRSPNGGC